MPSPEPLPFALRMLRRLPLPRKLGALERLFGRRLAARGVAWVQTADGPVWKLDLRSSDQRWIVYGDYCGPVFINWARRWLRSGGVVIDSGANVGQTLLYFASRPATKVYAFEPNPQCQAWLHECLAAQTGWDVTVVPQGLSDARSTMQLRVPGFTGQQGAQGTMRPDWYGTVAADTFSVKVDRLDDFLRARKIDRVRLWKLDVEGWEMQALRGAENALRAQAIDAIYVELHPSNAVAASAFLAGKGYSVYRMTSATNLTPYGSPSPETEDVLALAQRSN
jgi:FkbM family methyltransferase